MVSPQIVIVQWIDAYHKDGWAFGEPISIEADPCWTTGFLIEKNKKGLLIAQTWFPGDVANLIFIPNGMIEKVTEVGDLKFED